MIATFPFTKRLIDTTTSDRCDNEEFGKMRSDRIDHRSLLTDKEMARAMEHLNPPPQPRRPPQLLCIIAIRVR
jgi:hypothetical protein